MNEARIQFANDDLDRDSLREGEPIEAQIRFDGPAFSDSDAVGKISQLPIITRENNLQIQDNFSYLFGAHDLKFGAEYRSDSMRLLFAGAADGRYDFLSFEDFLANRAFQAVIFFGDVTFPNYDDTQELVAVYGQDSWRATPNLTINYGLRYSATLNPDGLEHLLEEGREVPDDTDNFAPRFGFAYAPTGRDVLRGGVGLFYGQTPALLYVNQYLENGLFPNLGISIVRPQDPGFVPLGTPIDNTNPPLNSTPVAFLRRPRLRGSGDLAGEPGLRTSYRQPVDGRGRRPLRPFRKAPFERRRQSRPGRRGQLRAPHLLEPATGPEARRVAHPPVGR